MEEQWNTLSVRRLGQSDIQRISECKPVVPVVSWNTRSKSTATQQSLRLKNTLVRPGLRVLPHACIVTVSHPQPSASMTLVRGFGGLIEGDGAEAMPAQWALAAC